MKKAGITIAITAVMFIAITIVFYEKENNSISESETTSSLTSGISKIVNDELAEPVVVESNVVEVKEADPCCYEEADIELLARLITAEQGYGADEKLYFYTGSVVLNRVNSDVFPNTLQEVIYQRNPLQYQCTENGHINRPYDDVAWEVAEALLTEGSVLPENVVYQAEFKQGSGVYEKIGRTYFCYKR